MKLFVLFSFLVLFAIRIFSQQVEFEFDYAQFGYDSSSNYVEFYYSFNQSSLTIVNTDTADYIKGILTLVIEDTSTSEVVLDKNWIISNRVSDTTNIDRSLIGIIGFTLAAGGYKCSISGYDAVKQESKKTFTDYINVKPFLISQAAISDIQLASNLIQGSENKESIFYKNTYEVTPNPTAIYGEGQPVLFYYTELYNLYKLSGDEGVRLDERLFDSRGRLIKSKRKNLTRSVDSRVEVGTVMTYKLPTDTYTLVLNLIDSVDNFGISSSKRFFVYNPSIVSTDTFQQKVSPVLSTQFGAMSEEELDDLFEKSRYLSTSLEADKYEALSTVEGKREFLYNFWKARDDNPDDDLNQSYTSYLHRLEECDLKFSAMNKKGWRTDRGRVYLIYGEPSEIERHPSQIESKPYEIWYYHEIEGGVYFIFADLFGFSDYQLVHSTKRGELRDDTWPRRISIQ